MADLGDLTASLALATSGSLFPPSPLTYQWKKLEGVLKYEGVASYRRFLVLDALYSHIIYAGYSHPDGTILVGSLSPFRVVRGVTIIAYDDTGTHNAQILDDIILADQ